MGVLRRRPIVLYRTDTGKVVAVDKMSVSHLMNAIAHHRKQMGVLEGILANYQGDLTYIEQRHSDLSATVDILEEELIARSPDDDPERHPTTIPNYDGVWDYDRW